MKLDLCHRFDFTIPDFFEVISQGSSSDTVDLQEMLQFCLDLGVTESQKPIPNMITNHRKFFNFSTEHYPNPPITPAVTAYLMARIMAPIEFLPDSLHVDYAKFQHFLLPFNSMARQQLLSRIPKTHRFLGDFTFETRAKLKQLIECFLISEMSADYWREKIAENRVSREDLAAWFGKGISSLCIFDLGEKINSETISDENLRVNRVNEKNLCNLFWRYDCDFSGEIDFWELEKMTLIRKPNQGGSIPIKL